MQCGGRSSAVFENYYGARQPRHASSDWLALELESSSTYRSTAVPVVCGGGKRGQSLLEPRANSGHLALEHIRGIVASILGVDILYIKNTWSVQPGLQPARPSYPVSVRPPVAMCSLEARPNLCFKGANF